MKFGKETLLTLAATCCLLTLQTDAFVPASIRFTKLALVNSRLSTSTTSPNKLSRTTAVRRLAADDDDLDSDDYDEGPLGKGIDSVSWLPSVAGKKGESVPSAKEVSDNILCQQGNILKVINDRIELGQSSPDTPLSHVTKRIVLFAYLPGH
jgi:hypothetical protein